MAKTCFFWDELEDNIVEEFDEGGVTIADYTTEPDHFGNVISQHRSSQSSFFHYDAPGSTLAVTDGSQTVTDTRAYSAFGETTENTGSTVLPFQYVGQKGYYFDSLNEVHLARRRHYRPILIRWLAIDPESKVLQFLSSYVYGSNRPVNYADPSGYAPLEFPSLPPSPGGPPSLPGPPSSWPSSDAEAVQALLDVRIQRRITSRI